MSRSRPLVDLNPHMLDYDGDGFPYLTFDCPSCIEPHPIGIHVGPQNITTDKGLKVWGATHAEDMRRITATPSILCRTPGCGFHGWIRDGQVTW